MPAASAAGRFEPGMSSSDTIFALSSGAGRSAIALIRVSGPAAGRLLRLMTGSLPPERSFAVRTISDPASGEPIDRAVTVWLPGPGSVTGEDCAEFHLHGGAAVVTAVLDILGSQDAVRPAEPGEFTRRSFLNGKMDLVEVEGLADLLSARTAGQRRQAFRQMSGVVSSVFEGWRNDLLSVRADIEAAVDFADEPGVEEAALRRIDSALVAIIQSMEEAMRRSASSELIRDGVRVVLAGRPNTGKSSLLNALAGREAAIVSSVPGTTRDAIEVTLELEGIPVILTDTAGLRSAEDAVEEEGIRRSRAYIGQADLVIWVWSSDIEASEAPESGTVPDLFVRSKSDIDGSGRARNDESISVSARSGEGLHELLAALSTMLLKRLGELESALVISARQKQALASSIRFLNEAVSGSTVGLEFKAEHVARASDEIGRLTGRIGVEEWLGTIFSRFCIGK
jgi:tRNA modification GTPase